MLSSYFLTQKQLQVFVCFYQMVVIESCLGLLSSNVLSLFLLTSFTEGFDMTSSFSSLHHNINYALSLPITSEAYILKNPSLGRDYKVQLITTLLFFTSPFPSPVTDEDTVKRYYAKFEERFFQTCEKELLKINTFYSGIYFL